MCLLTRMLYLRCITIHLPNLIFIKHREPLLLAGREKWPNKWCDCGPWYITNESIYTVHKSRLKQKHILIKCSIIHRTSICYVRQDPPPPKTTTKKNCWNDMQERSTLTDITLIKKSKPHLFQQAPPTRSASFSLMHTLKQGHDRVW